MYEKLVESLRNCVADENGCCFRCPEDCNGPCQENLMTEAANAIEELATKLATLQDSCKWVSATERPPEKDVPVFVYLFGDSPYIAWINRESEWETEEFTIDYDYLPKAYMPLPKPPKEET